MSQYELVVVVPVFNEARALKQWILDWEGTFSSIGLSPLFLFVDDSSTDDSAAILQVFAQKAGSHHVTILQNPGPRGHGNACLVGYQRAIELGPPWILQLDSDGQCDPASFQEIWSLRSQKFSVFGCRTSRLDGALRKYASKIVRLLTSAIFFQNMPDPNSPYRLMPTAQVARALPMIPPSFVLKNIALTALLQSQAPIARVSTTFRLRTESRPEKSIWFFADQAFRLAKELVLLRCKIATNEYPIGGRPQNRQSPADPS